MENRIKWLGEKIAQFLTEEHTHAELINMLRRIQEECESIAQIGNGPF